MHFAVITNNHVSQHNELYLIDNPADVLVAIVMKCLEAIKHDRQMHDL